VPKNLTPKSWFAGLPTWAIFLLFCFLLSLQVVLSVRQESATFDEPANLASAYVELKFGDHWLFPENLPFVKLLAGLPLLFVDVGVPRAVPPQINAWSFGRKFLYEANDGDALLSLGRVALLPLSLFLGCVIFMWSKELFGRTAGLFAFFLYAFEPNILAHSGLVTTDLAVTCFIFMLVYGLHRVAHQVSLSRVLLPTIAFGLGTVTKFSILPVILIMLLLGLTVSFSSQPLDIRIKGLPQRKVLRWDGKLITLLLVFLFMGLVAYGLIWAAYGFTYEAFAVRGIASPKLWGKALPQQLFLQKALLWARDTKVLPEAYLYGLSDLLGRSGGRVGFLMGEIRTGGWWYYFIVTFLIKTPVPLLLLVGLALLLLRERWRAEPVRAAFLLLPVLAYFGSISAAGWNVGHRHLLPIYPFLFVLVSALIPWALQQRPVIKAGVAALSAWYLVSSVAIFPHYLAYFNELAGGPGNGYKYLVDSNLDWGQDLKGLKRYMDAHRIPRIWLSYFGTASPEYYGISYNYLPSFVEFDPKYQQVPTPFVAISATNLQGVYFPSIGLDADFFKNFRGRQPVSKIGYSIFIYRLE
jgi:hypothetical protein